jgi:hypothetical protein
LRHVGAVFELAAFASRTAFATSIVTVPVFGLASARGPNAPKAADVPHLVGRRDRDVEIGEPLLDPLCEVGQPTTSAPPSAPGLVALSEDGNALLAAGVGGSIIVPRSCSSA